MFKKGVSPLIATVLLVMIVVSIGAAVMVVIQGITEEGIQTTEGQSQLVQCGLQVKVETLTIDGAPLACFSQETEGSNTNAIFAISLENKGMKDINDFVVAFLGSRDVNDNDGTTGLFKKGEIKRYKFNVSNMNNVLKIKLYPQIAGGPQNVVTCDTPYLEWDRSAIQNFVNCTGVDWDDNLASINIG